MSGQINGRSSLNAQTRGNRKRVGRSSASTPPRQGSRSTHGVPCGACKFMRRRCVHGCIFAPHFCPEHGAEMFAAVHKIFGASNMSKLLAQLPPHLHYHAVQTLLYEAKARLADPVCGCVSVVFYLYQQVASLQMELAMAKKLLAEKCMAANAPQGPSQQPEQLNNLDLQPVHSNGSSASNNNNMNMFDSNLHSHANDHQCAVHSQPISEPVLFAGPYFKNEDDDVEADGGTFLFVDQMFK